MMHRYAALNDTLYFWFAANDTSGSGADGATPVFDVRLAGAAAGAAPILSGAATLLSHGDYPAGAHEIAVAATAGNGFAAGSTYAVFCTLAVDGQNPTGFVGSFTLGPVVADLTTIHGTALTETAGQLAGRFVDFFDQATAAFSVATNLLPTDIYSASHTHRVGDTDANDKHAVAWFKNGVVQTSDVTNAKIQVVKWSDGTDLIAQTVLTQIGATGYWKYTATTTQRINDGTLYLVILTATIDAATRTWPVWIGRDG